MVLEGGVVEGRKVFANILKYIRMSASSNVGNMFSVLGASAFLPFMPMAPIQVLTNNLLYDFSQVPIPGDAVHEEQVAGPRPWNIEEQPADSMGTRAREKSAARYQKLTAHCIPSVPKHLLSQQWGIGEPFCGRFPRYRPAG
jgi:hypothetical protein